MTKRKKNTIVFNGKTYPTRHIYGLNKGVPYNFKVATFELEDMLYDENGVFVSEYAEHIDSIVDVFVPNNIFCLSDDDLRDYVEYMSCSNVHCSFAV